MSIASHGGIHFLVVVVHVGLEQAEEGGEKNALVARLAPTRQLTPPPTLLVLDRVEGACVQIDQLDMTTLRKACWNASDAV